MSENLARTIAKYLISKHWQKLIRGPRPGTYLNVEDMEEHLVKDVATAIKIKLEQSRIK